MLMAAAANAVVADVADDVYDDDDTDADATANVEDAAAGFNDHDDNAYKKRKENVAEF
ncbi:hypothetical protein DPMN_193757 [Dreissena polymorpha]|uniref:Uncharacterized protein n=1 Tax=Dreissena polymorpha TaxID=45954 RepID=A0A9D3XY13_DREPO|nr:hypothetical protein DPMN_193757 [Dreissena polymorpha]